MCVVLRDRLVATAWKLAHTVRFGPSLRVSCTPRIAQRYPWLMVWWHCIVQHIPEHLQRRDGNGLGVEQAAVARFEGGAKAKQQVRVRGRRLRCVFIVVPGASTLTGATTSTSSSASTCCTMHCRAVNLRKSRWRACRIAGTRRRCLGSGACLCGCQHLLVARRHLQLHRRTRDKVAVGYESPLAVHLPTNRHPLPIFEACRKRKAESSQTWRTIRPTMSTALRVELPLPAPPHTHLWPCPTSSRVQ